VPILSNPLERGQGPCANFGGVAEILQGMITILTGLGINTLWEVIEGNLKYFDITKNPSLNATDTGLPFDMVYTRKKW
jgi:hypothetical protein